MIQSTILCSPRCAYFSSEEMLEITVERFTCTPHGHERIISLNHKSHRVNLCVNIISWQAIVLNSGRDTLVKLLGS